jgi:hypothetical protein
MKRILVQFDFQSVTSQQYDNVWKDLKTAGYANPHGLISHVSAEKPNGGWKVVDIWESEDAFQTFGQTLMPILANNNVPLVQPEILPVYWIHEKRLEPA